VRSAAQRRNCRIPNVATDLPLESDTAGIFTPEGADLGGIVPPTRRSLVHGAYFQTLGISLRRGRLFTDDELAANRQVVIVNEKLASRYWPGEDPVGKRLKWGAPQNNNPWLTVVGVVADTIDGREAVATMGDDRPVHVHEPLANAGPVGRDIKVAVLTRGDPTMLAGPVRRELANLDPQLAVAKIATMEDRLNDNFAPQRFSTALVTPRVWPGPAFHCPPDLAAGAAVRITAGNAELLTPYLEDWRVDVDAGIPWLLRFMTGWPYRSAAACECRIELTKAQARGRARSCARASGEANSSSANAVDARSTWEATPIGRGAFCRAGAGKEVESAPQIHRRSRYALRPSAVSGAVRR
jgi:hypothetical protein